MPNAVATCKHAGIVVRMVTGDNVHTAQHIARECGILTEGGLALEGPQFRVMPEHELVNLLPRLQVNLLSHPCCSFWPLISTYRPWHALFGRVNQGGGSGVVFCQGLFCSATDNFSELPDIAEMQNKTQSLPLL